jgi:hypothetical protein
VVLRHPISTPNRSRSTPGVAHAENDTLSAFGESSCCLVTETLVFASDRCCGHVIDRATDIGDDGKTGAKCYEEPGGISSPRIRVFSGAVSADHLRGVGEAGAVVDEEELVQVNSRPVS